MEFSGLSWIWQRAASISPNHWLPAVTYLPLGTVLLARFTHTLHERDNSTDQLSPGLRGNVVDEQPQYSLQINPVLIALLDRLRPLFIVFRVDIYS